MKWRCLKPNCSYHIVYYECSKISSEEMKECIYKCNCKIEYLNMTLSLVLNCLEMFLFFMLVTTATLNVNVGLRDDIKQKCIFKYLLDCNFHIPVILLQKTHSTTSIEHIWRNEWLGYSAWSHGSSSSKKMAVLLNPSFEGGFINHK